ncbi:restriction endonuclease [Aurantimonas sp. E1-2-R+4]|uniref:restriction endonuclease n=1 Tax=Aurantimonas sp. E1-2-R+4 TaxID=3113714 RepID=UPI002F95F30A
MTNVWCVRADFGRYARAFVDGGFVAIGWLPGHDLADYTSRDELHPIYRAAYPNDVSNIVIGQQIGQIGRFLFEMKGGDTVITPDANTELLHHGVIRADPSYRYEPNDPTTPYPHHRLVDWSTTSLLRSSLSVPLQNTMRSSLTVFGVSQIDEVLHLTGRGNLAPAPHSANYDPYQAVLAQILELDDKEFEILVGHLLTALGFEGSEVVGKVGDGGVDATGELNVANLAKVKVFVQAKRYKVGTNISASVVRQLRQAIPFGGQGAFITTAGFQKAAFDVALEAGFPRIGLVNGSQLVDLLVEHWPEIPVEFKDRLGLKPGLVLA